MFYMIFRTLINYLYINNHIRKVKHVWFQEVSVFKSFYNLSSTVISIINIKLYITVHNESDHLEQSSDVDNI